MRSATTKSAADAPAPAFAGESDRELVRRMASGDERALGALYDRWVTLVHSLVLRLLRDRDDAEEVVEEAFWQAWSQAERYNDERGAVSTWLTTIARSRALDRMRARQRRREEPWSQLDQEEVEIPRDVESDGNPLAQAEASEQRTVVLAALGALPPEQRQTIELAYYSGLSQSEIATVTGQPLGTVKTRVRLGMDKLRERLSMLREEAR